MTISNLRRIHLVRDLRQTAQFCALSGIIGFLGLTDGFAKLANQPLGIDYWAGNLVGISFASAGLLGLLVQARKLLNIAALLESQQNSNDPLAIAMAEHEPRHAPLSAWIVICSPIWLFSMLGFLSSKIAAAILIMYYALFAPFVLLLFWLAYCNDREPQKPGYKISLVLLVGTIVFRSIYLVL